MSPETPKSAVPPRLANANRKKSNSVVSTDFETAIRKAGCGTFNVLIMLIAVPASCTSSFVTATMSFVVPVAGPDLGLTPFTKALLQSSPYTGMILSAIFWGVLSDSMGRQRLLAIGFLLDFLMNTLCALIPTLPTIILFKVLSGMMVCGPYSIFMAYLAEVFSDKQRSLAVLSAGLFSHTGGIIHACVALALIPSEMPSWLPLRSWQVFILVCGLPALLSGIGCLFSVESPKFLLEKGKTQRALEVCQTIYVINTGKSTDRYPVTKIHQPEETVNRKKSSAKEKIFLALSIFRPPFISRLLLVFAMQMCIAASMNTVRLWLPEMLTVMSSADSSAANGTLLCPLLLAGKEAQAMGKKIVSGTDVYIDMMIVSTCCLAGHILFMVMVKFLKKTVIMMGVAVIGGVCAVLIPHVSAQYIFIPASLMVAFLNSGFYAAIAIVVEIFPTSVRATSVSLQMMMGRLGILSANFLFTNLIYSYCEIVFYNLAVLCTCLFVICLFIKSTPITSAETKNSETS